MKRCSSRASCRPLLSFSDKVRPRPPAWVGARRGRQTCERSRQIAAKESSNDRSEFEIVRTETGRQRGTALAEGAKTAQAAQARAEAPGPERLSGRAAVTGNRWPGRARYHLRPV